MSTDLQGLLEDQNDILKAKLLGEGRIASTFKVKLMREGKTKNQIVRVIRGISNHYAVKREKDLLQYLNQFPEFPRFNEIRKVGVYYLQFFDYVGKSNLTRLVNKKGSLSQNKTRRLLSDMVRVLTHVHGAGFLHTNIGPDNIILGKKQYYLVDWSHALPALKAYETEVIDEDARYCPPERLNGELDEKGDIYSLGCTLYFALTGKHIYRLKNKSTQAQQFWAHAHHSVHKMNKLPIFWRYLIFWMTQKDPEKRPSLNDLTLWLEDVTVPEWVRRMSVRAEKSYPKDIMTVLADEHFLYPIFVKAQKYEQKGDLISAFNLYENGAFRGYGLAEEKIGKMYETGEPVEKSYSMAANMYHHAYQRGNPNAAFNLANMFAKGLGMPENLQQAFKLYRFAAIRGHSESQSIIANMYIKGIGTTKNMAQGQSWLALVANNGCEKSQGELQKITALSGIAG